MLAVFAACVSATGLDVRATVALGLVMGSALVSAAPATASGDAKCAQVITREGDPLF